MKKHKPKDALHCKECFDAAVKSMIERDKNQQPVYCVSSEQYPFCAKYGITNGLVMWMESKQKSTEA